MHTAHTLSLVFSTSDSKGIMHCGSKGDLYVHVVLIRLDGEHFLYIYIRTLNYKIT